MQARRVLKFLGDLSANNNREWFTDHKDEYNELRKDFEKGVALAIARLSTFDQSIAHLTVKDVTYRFNRDTRFSPDKSPYKNHFGAYISAHGKKSFHGGYYFHLENNNCLIACGNYYLPTKILNAVRNTIIDRIDEYRPLVENDDFKNSFDHFGNEKLKTCPIGFPKDFPYMEYLRMKDYCCWKNVDDSFFEGDRWLDKFEKTCRVAKPMMDFVNDVIDDYE